jgi:imidazoleglycerol-phosphate dehydratase
MDRTVTVERNTKETRIKLKLDPDGPGSIKLDLDLPFFEHMLTALAFHGGFGLEITGKGDLDVDPHHLVEDVGLVLGQALAELLEKGPVKRYGHALIPMDDALAEAVVDVCRRPYLVHRVEYPQARCGNFEICLLKEFFQALANRAQINLHLIARYGENSHHIAEALCKAAGKALFQAYFPTDAGSDPGTSGMSTKGSI